VHIHERDAPIWVVSLVFSLLGIAEIIIGLVIDSTVLLVLGVHNIFDGGMYGISHKAEEWEHRPGYNPWRCQAAPLAAIGIGILMLLSSLGVLEFAPEAELLLNPWLALVLAVIDFGLNRGFAQYIGGHQHPGAHRIISLIHLYGDVAVGAVSIAGIVAALTPLADNDQWAGTVGNWMLIIISLVMLGVGILDYRKHLPRHNHIHPAADHHHA
jgi:Co/Zn/Cd efflux system component